MTPKMPIKLEGIKDLEIEVFEGEKQTQLTISYPSETREFNKEVMITYRPLDHYERGEFEILDNQKSIEISRGYPVGTCDSDVDWDCETIYPCQRCGLLENGRKKAEKEVENLEKLIKILVDVIKEK